MRVIEVSEHLSAAFAGMLLAELGAEVVKVEPLGGDPWRTRPDQAGDDSTFVFANRRKKSVALDITKPSGARAFRSLVAEADAVVEDLGRWQMADLGLGYNNLRRRNRGLVMASISPFGQDGPHAGWQSSDLVAQAMGGIVHNTGWDGEPPLKLGGHTASLVGGIHAATAVLAAVYGIETGAEGGVHIDVSLQEAFSHHWSRHIAQWCYSGTGTRRERREQGRQGFPHSAMAADGWLYILALYAGWEELAFFLGLEPFITSEFSEPEARARRWPEIEPHFYQSVASKGRYQWFAEAAEQGYTFAPIDDPLEIMASPQMQSRGFFKPGEADGREVPVAGLPFSFDLPGLAPNRAPDVGEHTLAVLREARVGEEEILRLKKAGVIGGRL